MAGSAGWGIVPSILRLVVKHDTAKPLLFHQTMSIIYSLLKCIIILFSYNFTPKWCAHSDIINIYAQLFRRLLFLSTRFHTLFISTIEKVQEKHHFTKVKPLVVRFSEKYLSKHLSIKNFVKQKWLYNGIAWQQNGSFISVSPLSQWQKMTFLWIYEAEALAWMLNTHEHWWGHLQ